MSKASRPLVGCLLLVMVSTLVAFPVNHVSSGHQLNITPMTDVKETMTQLVDAPMNTVAAPNQGGVKTQNSAPDIKLLREMETTKRRNQIRIFYNSGKRDSVTDVDSRDLERNVYIKILKRCVNCSGNDVNDGVTTERPVFMFDPLGVSMEKEELENEEPTPPTNNSLIILPLMAIIVFIGTVVAKCCRWTQKDVREVGFIVEAKPVKKKTIAKGIMQMHRFGMPIASGKIKGKKGSQINMRSHEQFMFLPLLLGHTVQVTNKPYTRSKTPPKSLSAGSGHRFHPLTETHDPGFDASDDTDDEKLVKTAGRKRLTSQFRDSEKGKSPTPPSRGSRSSKRSRSTSKDKVPNIEGAGIELDSSEEERLELEEQCRRGLQVLAQLDPRPLRRSSFGASMSSSTSSKCTSGRKLSVKADVHASAASSNDLKLPPEPHGSRHSSADACVDTHDLIDHMEDYYGVDIKAFINLWHHRRRYVPSGDSFDQDSAGFFARTHEIKRSQSAKRPKKPKPSIKRQVSFPLDLPQTVDPDSPRKPDVSTPSLSCAISNDDDVFVMPQDILQATPIHEKINYEKRFEESLELRDLSVSSNAAFDLPLSPTSSKHSICDDSGYHNHSFSKLVTSPLSPAGSRLQRTSSDDSALATNLASESSQSNHEDTPKNQLHAPVISHTASSRSLSDLTPKENFRLNCSDSQETCGSDSMQRTDPLCTENLHGATCNSQEYVHENGVFENDSHKPILKPLTNHVDMFTCDSETSGDTDKLLDRSDSIGSGFEDTEKSRRNSGLFNSARELPANLCKRGSGSFDGRAPAGVDVDDEVISGLDDSYDSSPNAPLLQNSIIASRDREKSTDRENNNEHMV